MSGAGNGTARRRRREPRRWKFAPRPAAEAVTRLRRESGVCVSVARLLVQRGWGEPEQAERFLARRLSDLHEPMLLPDMERAASRLAEAVRRRERVVLFGDYDVDGLCAAALFADFLSLAGLQVEALVPERSQGGYGLTAPAVARVRALRPDLVVTLDNGITAHTAVETLKADGVVCIVVDHHHVTAAGLPAADAVVNPKCPDSHYPFPDLCGAGLAFKLAWATAAELSHNCKVSPEFRAFLLRAAGLAGMATIADVVPLVGENRILAAHGLRALGTAQAPGLRALLEVCRIRGEPTAHDVAFRLAPRLNAAGRVGRAADALQLLRAADAREAQMLAEKLDGLNRKRRALEDAVFQDAGRRAEEYLAAPDAPPLLFFAAPAWHPGVLGIVASRLTEAFHRPTVLLSVDEREGVARGSGRSLPGFHLAEAFERGAAHTLSFGGHAAAAGVTLNADKVEDFRAALMSAAAEIPPEILEPSLLIDEVLSFAELNEALCLDLAKLEPCGEGNPAPLFALHSVELVAPPRPMGAEERHLAFYFRDGRRDGGQRSKRAVGFGFGERFNELCGLYEESCRGGTGAGLLDLAGRPVLNEFRGERSVEFHLTDFRRSEA